VAPAPELGEEVLQESPTHSMSQPDRNDGASVAAAPQGVPEELSIPFLKSKIQSVINACRRHRIPEKVLLETYDDLHLETASSEKLEKINHVLHDIRANSWHYVFGKSKDKAHIDLTVTVHDWDRDRSRTRR
jgi:hypothetical protein